MQRSTTRTDKKCNTYDYYYWQRRTSMQCWDTSQQDKLFSREAQYNWLTFVWINSGWNSN